MAQEFIDYGFVPTTPIEVYEKHEPIHVEGLYYEDDDGNKVTPHTVWFSCDTRNWRQDPTLGPGRAKAMYGGRRGTTLTPVYTPDGKPFRCDDLCNVSARYRNGVLCDFYVE